MLKPLSLVLLGVAQVAVLADLYATVDHQSLLYEYLQEKGDLFPSIAESILHGPDGLRADAWRIGERVAESIALAGLKVWVFTRR